MAKVFEIAICKNFKGKMNSINNAEAIAKDKRPKTYA